MRTQKKVSQPAGRARTKVSDLTHHVKYCHQCQMMLVTLLDQAADPGMRHAQTVIMLHATKIAATMAMLRGRGWRV